MWITNKFKNHKNYIFDYTGTVFNYAQQFYNHIDISVQRLLWWLGKENYQFLLRISVSLGFFACTLTYISIISLLRALDMEGRSFTQVSTLMELHYFCCAKYYTIKQQQNSHICTKRTMFHQRLLFYSSLKIILPNIRLETTQIMTWNFIRKSNLLKVGKVW